MPETMISCPRCDSERVVKNGFNHNGNQNFKCKNCSRQFTLEPKSNVIRQESKDLIDKLLLEKMPLTSIARVAGVSEQWLETYVNSKYTALPDQVQVPDNVAIVKSVKSAMKTNSSRRIVGKWVLIFVLATILLTPFVVVNAGQRGVVMQFGKVQEKVLGEGIHVIIPIVNTVKNLSVRVQNQEISAEASSKDLQDVFTDVALNWHIISEEANAIFQEIGDEEQVIERIISPAVEEVLKAIMAGYTAEEIITKREEVKAGVDDLLTTRLANYHVAVDDISLVHVHFSERFRDAVEAKQIAEQEAKRSEFVALKAIKQAETMVNLAKGEAEAQRLVRETLTPEILQKQTIEKWDGELPKIASEGGKEVLNLSKFIQTNEK